MGSRVEWSEVDGEIMMMMRTKREEEDGGKE